MTRAPSHPKGAAFAEREFRFTPRDFQQIADMLYAEAGILLSETKAPLVYARLVKRLRLLGLESFTRYCELVNSDGGLAERERMMAALTTNVTSFFREPHHFEHLKTAVLPPLLEGARRGERVRIWSAGCSSGEEPYSIALSILELMPDAGRFDIRVLATDINTEVLAHGKCGLYREAALSSVDGQARAKWFTPAPLEAKERGWQAGPDLITLVAFRELNLMQSWPMTALYQAIFCRNVLIYFDTETQARVCRRMAPLLTPGGRLYLGHSERLQGGEEMFAPEAATTYRRRAEDPRSNGAARRNSPASNV